MDKIPSTSLASFTAVFGEVMQYSLQVMSQKNVLTLLPFIFMMKVEVVEIFGLEL